MRILAAFALVIGVGAMIYYITDNSLPLALGLPAAAVAVAGIVTKSVLAIHDKQLQDFLTAVRIDPANVRLRSELGDKLMTLPVEEIATVLMRLGGTVSQERRNSLMRTLGPRSEPLSDRVAAQILNSLNTEEGSAG